LIVKGRVNDVEGVDDVEEKEDDAKCHPIFTSELKVKLMTQLFKKCKTNWYKSILSKNTFPGFMVSIKKATETRKRDSAEDVGL
jgi:hypothetical protein